MLVDQKPEPRRRRGVLAVVLAALLAALQVVAPLVGQPEAAPVQLVVKLFGS